MTSRYPAWICHDCGVKHGRRIPTMATFHSDQCGICRQEKACTEPRDYGHLKPGWDRIMTFDYRSWRLRHQLTHPEAARYLGISLRLSHYWSQPGRDIRRTAIIACTALDAQKEGDRA